MTPEEERARNQTQPPPGNQPPPTNQQTQNQQTQLTPPPAQDPAVAAGYTGQRKDESTVGNKDWDPGWAERLRKSGQFSEEDLSEKNLWDPQHRAYLNKKLKAWQQSQKKQGGGGAGGGAEPAPPPMSEPEPAPGPERGGERNQPPPGEWPPRYPGPTPPGWPGGGWLPNQVQMPWGGGGRSGWGQGPQTGAGYPGAPSYPGQGQSYPVPGYPGRGAPSQEHGNWERTDEWLKRTGQTPGGGQTTFPMPGTYPNFPYPGQMPGPGGFVPPWMQQGGMYPNYPQQMGGSLMDRWNQMNKSGEWDRRY